MSEFDFLLKINTFHKSLGIQKTVLSDYWASAEKVLYGSGITLKPLPKKWLTLKHNYFSVLFITLYHILGIPNERIQLYARINHCMRAWVTACDNILDNELKELILTDLPEDAHVFKSVHTVLVTDRIFFMFLREAVSSKTISENELEVLLNSSLSALTASGIEEAEEESGVDYSLSPDEILNSVHDAKTGQLFTSPLAAPFILGDIQESDEKAAWAKEGLHTFGLACQVLDDLSDLGIDVAYRKNNYMASVITHNNNISERNKFDQLLESDPQDLEKRIDLYQEFPEAARFTLDKSLSLYHKALTLLCDAGLPLDIAKRESFVKILLKLFGFPKELYKIREY